MIQIPKNLKPENFTIEPIEQSKIIEKQETTMKNQKFTIHEIRTLFYIEYKTMFKRDFELTIESNQYLSTLLCYFFKDQRFFNSTCLIIPKGTTPSFDKGLLVMGNTGIGKTSVLLALDQVFKTHTNFNPKTHFKPMTANEVVIEFAKLKDAEEREAFYKKHQGGFKLYDDIKSEDDASNFGKVNLFKKILHLRNAKGSKTLVTCNYDPLFPDNFEKGLDEFGVRYDERIYDRLFSDFNFIQVGGKSYRR